MTSSKHFAWTFLALVALLAIAIVSGCWRAQVLGSEYSHPDEEIARAVVSKVLATKKKDTNWARTDVEKTFHYNQFNFSTYYLAAAKIEKLDGHAATDLADPAKLIANLRKANVWWASIAVLLSGLLGWRLSSTAGYGARFGPIAGIAAALMTASCVTLFQDSIYARPEAFATALTLAFVLALLTEALAPLALLALAGLLLGALIACKITFALFLPFPLLVVGARIHARARATPDALHQTHPWRTAALCGAYALSIVAGFGLGAPYSLPAPWEYLEGVAYLVQQYNGDGWSRELHDSVFARFAHGIAYLVYTDGVVLLVLACVGLGVLVRKARHAPVLALTGPLLTLVYFLQTQAFFERNFSHALPMLFALAGLGLVLCADWIARRIPYPRRALPLQLIAACALIGLLCYPAESISAKLRRVLLGDGMEQRVAAAQREASRDGALPVLYGYSFVDGVADMRNGLCGEVIYKLLDMGDPVAQQKLAELNTRGYRIAAQVPGPFDGAPYSTLQSYHAAGVLFLASPPDPPETTCKGKLVAPTPDARYVAIDAQPTLTGQWTRDGYPPDMSLHGWGHAFYASWSGSDANTGEFQLGPFRACSELIVPYAVGPSRDNLELSIERESNGLREVIHSGQPPPAITWTAIRIPAPASCASYTIRATDHGGGYGQWLGVGIPVELNPVAAAPLAPAAQSDSANAAAKR